MKPRVRRVALFSGLVYFAVPGRRDAQRLRDLAVFGTYYGQRGWRPRYRRGLARLTRWRAHYPGILWGHARTER